MSKLIAIALSSIILIQSLNFGVDDIAQLDDLIEHAQFHKKEHGDNFLVFLSKHYGELKAEHDKEHHEEKEEHEKLPFQCQGHASIIIASLPQNSGTNFNEFEILNSLESSFYYLNLYASLHETELLQPPKHA